ncbi:DUF547 domain-containing protein [Daejeonella sp.]|uniref:DUF547 domain-containing protein n=1 Tax=Daejeonella sp. TaxID=2805397 RepID=UPI0030C6229E
MKKIFFLISYLLLAINMFAQKVPSHQAWDKLLKEHVNASGMVNYKGFKRDKSEFDAYLKTLSDNPPQKNWSQNDEKAFWINAYNAYTISLILQKYPVKSIKDIAGKIYKVNTPWDIKFINIGGKQYDLNNIEHSILRKKFNDPRIHFALVCAAMSCPRLRNEAYAGAKLNAQLETAGKDFLNDKAKNSITADKAELSKYFTWYGGDFTKNGSLVDFINKYSKTQINSNTKISYLDYSWSLNEQK